MSEPIHVERQVLLATPIGLMLAVLMIMMNIGAGMNAPAWVLVLLAAVTIGVLSIRMTVRVDPDRVRVSYPPLGWRSIPVDRILSATATTYSPLVHYAGWGPYRPSWMPGRPTAWTVSGNQGVLLRLEGERDVLLGSRSPESLAEAINSTCGVSAESGAG